MNSPRTTRSYTRATVLGAVALGVVAIACSNRVTNDVMAPAPMTAAKAAQLPAGQQAYFEFQVEKPVGRVATSPFPKYPDILKTAGVEGEVLAQFVVDESGIPVAGTLKILKFSHALFVKAIQDVFADMRFTPAEVGGKKVKQLVQAPYVFAITKYSGAASTVGAPPNDTSWKGGKGVLKLGTTVVVVRDTTPAKKP